MLVDLQQHVSTQQAPVHMHTGIPTVPHFFNCLCPYQSFLLGRGSAASCQEPWPLPHRPLCRGSPPPLSFSYSVHLEPELVQKISLTFEELQGFREHAQSSPPGSERKLVYIGVIPSIACMSVQLTCSRLWAELVFLCPRKFPLFLFSFFFFSVVCFWFFFKLEKDLKSFLDSLLCTEGHSIL